LLHADPGLDPLHHDRLAFASWHLGNNVPKYQAPIKSLPDADPGVPPGIGAGVPGAAVLRGGARLPAHGHQVVARQAADRPVGADPAAAALARQRAVAARRADALEADPLPAVRVRGAGVSDG